MTRSSNIGDNVHPRFQLVLEMSAKKKKLDLTHDEENQPVVTDEPVEFEK